MGSWRRSSTRRQQVPLAGGLGGVEDSFHRRVVHAEVGGDAVQRVAFVMGGKTIASTTRAWRVLETSHLPTNYLPRDAFFAERVMSETSGSSWCEWKGQATFYDLVTETRIAPKAAWSYLNPSPEFEPIAGAVAVMAGKVDRCTSNGEEVIPQPGGFYGGWIISRGRRPVQRSPGVDGLVAGSG
ncbi:MAG TPA: DUF427 domain-containing protein [Pseudonocardiaceae bacterium]|nr:DUF427 domain-containing protein [Pseudonocardiaceae bacterium]